MADSSATAGTVSSSVSPCSRRSAIAPRIRSRVALKSTCKLSDALRIKPNPWFVRICGVLGAGPLANPLAAT
jgi:hypothetical protein